VDYDYFELTLGREPGAAQALARHVYRELGDAAVAVFAPLLGFPLNHALVLTTHGGSQAAVLRAPGVVRAVQARLSPTLRPKDGERPAPMGIYTHNWFTIDDRVDEFVRLSGQAWPDFEASFKARVFGLFVAEASDEDRRQAQRRMLLMTGYSDLNEWQVSRNPAPTARQAFERRRQLTRSSLARACTLIPRTGGVA
jgi:hypothetical protein